MERHTYCSSMSFFFSIPLPKLSALQISPVKKGLQMSTVMVCKWYFQTEILFVSTIFYCVIGQCRTCKFQFGELQQDRERPENRFSIPRNSFLPASACPY